MLGSFLLGTAAVWGQVVPAPCSLAAWVKTSRWQKRVLLLYAPTPDNADLLHQRQLLAAARPGLDERELLIREVVFNTLTVPDRNYLTETLRVSRTGFTLLLLGKDGGIKRRETKPVSPSSLFATVDAMPMRQREMKSSKRR